MVVNKKRKYICTSGRRRSARVRKKPDWFHVTNSVGVNSKKVVRKEEATVNKKERCSSKRPLSAQDDVIQVQVKRRALNADVTVYKRDPLFEMPLDVPFVSPNMQSKLTIRAVLRNDKRRLKTLLEDYEHVSCVNVVQSVDRPMDTLQYALMREDLPLVRLIISHMEKLERQEKQRIVQPKCLLRRLFTGSYFDKNFGHSLRPIGVSRKGREGLNAFLKAEAAMGDWSSRLKLLLSYDASFSFLQELLAAEMFSRFELTRNVASAVRFGHRILAADIIAASQDQRQFNLLHLEVLRNEKEKLTAFRRVSILKKATFASRITPLLCACINPNTHILEELIASEPEWNHVDEQKFGPLHYAMACKTSGPLEVLLSHGAVISRPNTCGDTPLHHGCIVGRAENVQYLLDHLTKSSCSPSLDILTRKNRKGFTALHEAVSNGHLDVVKVLCSFSCPVDVIASTVGGLKVTPLMVAAQKGYLDIAEYLIQRGADVNKRDHLKRSAIVHSALNGTAHVMSLLLRCGADGSLADSSGNTAVHYAAAYGWYHCLTLLQQANIPMNATNDWQLTPMMVAFLNGQRGLVNFFTQLSNDDIGVNCTAENGMTLMAVMLSEGVDQSDLTYLKCFLDDQGANPNLPDQYGNNAFHHLASSEVRSIPAMLSAADMLIKARTNVFAVNKEGLLPINVAFRHGNVSLCEVLLKAGSLPCTVEALGASSDLKDNVLHDLVKYCGHVDGSGALFRLLQAKHESSMRILMSQTNSDGHTPLIACCDRICNFRCSSREHESDYKEKQQTEMQNLFDLFDQMRSCFPECLFALDLGPSAGGKVPRQRTILHMLISSTLDQWRDHLEKLFAELTAFYKCHPKGPTVVEHLDWRRRTPLANAICKGKDKYASIIINAGMSVSTVSVKSADGLNDSKKLAVPSASAFFDQKDYGIINAALVACCMLKVDMLKTLLSSGASVNEEDADGYGLLHYVAKQSPSVRSAEVIEILLNAGADVNHQSRTGVTALHMACLAYDGRDPDACSEVIETLLSRGADPFVSDEFGRPPAYYLFVKNCYASRADIHRGPTDPVVVFSTFLHCMPAERLLTLRDKDGMSILHCTCIAGANLCTFQLLRKGDKTFLNATDAKGNSPLALACLFQQKACALTMLEAGSDVRIDAVERGEAWKCYMDLKRTNEYMLDYMGDEPPEFVSVGLYDVLGRNGWLDLLHVVFSELLEAHLPFHSLLKAVINANLLSVALALLRSCRKRQTPGGYLLSFEQALEVWCCLGKAKNADVVARIAETLATFRPLTALHTQIGMSEVILLASKYGNTTLLDFFKDVLERVFFDAANTLLVGLMNFLCKGGFDKAPDDVILWLEKAITNYGARLNACYQWTCCHERQSGQPVCPLVHSFLLKETDVCKRFIQLGADANFQDSNGRTAAMHAIRLNRLDILEILLSCSPPADLSLIDNQRRNILHYFTDTQPKGGSYENVRMFRRVAPLVTSIGKDASGKSPYDYALHRGLGSLASAMRTHYKLRKCAVRYESFRVAADDFLDKFAYDVVADANCYIEQADETKRRAAPKPCSSSGYKEIGELLVDPKLNRTYSVFLSKVDVSRGPYGYFAFYRMQLVGLCNRTRFVLYTNWGRHGFEGRSQITPFDSMASAVKEFEKIFKSKTNNEWAEIDRFVAKPRRYRLLKESRGVTKYSIRIDLNTELESSMPKHLQQFINGFMVVSRVMRDLKIALSFCPIQTVYSVHPDTVKQASLILDKVEELLTAHHEAVELGDTAQVLAVLNKLEEAWSEFHATLPLAMQVYSVTSTTTAKVALRGYRNKLRLLSELGVAVQIFYGAAFRRFEIHPIDYAYGALQCRFELLRSGSEEARRILLYIKRSAQVDVRAIYKVYRENLANSFCSETDNRMLLWHGTRSTNLMSILTAGLLIQSVVAIHTGTLFGEGIYTSNVFSKSMGYCDQEAMRYVLLCEVALGRTKRFNDWDNLSKFDAAEIAASYDSLQAIGRYCPDPRASLTLPNGCVIPLGEVICRPEYKDKECYLEHDEFVVYNEKRIIVRYVVVFGSSLSK
ncbi:PARP and WGR and Ank 2 domain containing protein [Trichuris trichiura]|uniref:Poly [ADP-ribose] polymerase n=1 Tax=Trichuris trichiura TaxID=36087 RepID=A0A077ZD56_TRITR|nr:PARP and WGR and Ank 2 domain containing protein [Trichuris trichiura]